MLITAITFIAAIVNGALGYGFSSITVPVALLFLTNRVLTPALVPIEVVLNAWVLWVNRRALPGVRWRVVPVIIGLVPGVMVGTYFIATANPAWLKFWTFVILLPLILLQAAGFRHPIKAERPAGLALGGGVGVCTPSPRFRGRRSRRCSPTRASRRRSSAPRSASFAWPSPR